MLVLVIAAYAVAVPSMMFIDTLQSLVQALDRKPAATVAGTKNRL
jgi:hypothetical protein